WPGHGGTVVLLHGAGLIANLWWPVAARLSQRWRVLAPDLPGHGRSDARPGGAQLTINALAAWAAAVAPDLRAVVGMGSSGGRLAAAVAFECEATAVICGANVADSFESLASAEWPARWEMFAD